MTVKGIHTSDWQIGKVFRFLDKAAMGLLQYNVTRFRISHGLYRKILTQEE